MHKKILVVICILHWAGSVNAYANYQDQIATYIRNNFPADFAVNKTQIEQLAWAFQHNKHTPDRDAQVKDQQIYVEISRALTRLYCMHLLRSASREAYEQFVQAQLATNVPNPLSFAEFTRLAAHIQQLDILDYELLEAAAILSAVSLSKPAAELAQQAMDVQPVINDNMGFLAATVRNGINIFPLTTQLMRDNTAAKKLMYILFPPQTNFRHMLYTEGGVGMFKYLRTMIRHGFIDRAGLDLWYAHWIVNIAGFRGHIDQRGSIYLQEPVAQAMHKLKGLVYELLDTPNFDPLVPYLEYRAQGLGFTHLPYEERLFMAHLGCLLRLYDVAAGQRLYRSVQRVPKQQIQALKTFFLQGLKDPNQKTPMHLPALLGNALHLTGDDLEQVIVQILPIYNTILHESARQNLTASLTLNKLSMSANVAKLLHKSATHESRFKILNDGTVILG